MRIGNSLELVSDALQRQEPTRMGFSSFSTFTSVSVEPCSVGTRVLRTTSAIR